MKLIINTVNLKIGGAFQRAVSFLKELKDIGHDEYHIFLNQEIMPILKDACPYSQAAQQGGNL